MADGVGILFRQRYKGQYALPLYLIVTSESRAWMDVGNHYYIGVDRGDETHWLHESICLGRLTVDSLDEIPDLVLAFAAETRDKDELMEFLEETKGDDNQFWICPMLRVDAAKDFVINKLDSLPTDESQVEAITSINIKTDSDMNTSQAKKEIREEQE